MEKEVVIAIIGALAVMGGAVIQSGILDHILGFDEGGGPDLTEAPVVTSLEPGEAGPQEVGSVITWTATAIDPDSSRLLYRFSAKKRSSDEWVIGKDWSTQNSWDWVPSEAGSYQVLMEVRDGDHSGPEGNDDFRTKSYEIEELAGSGEAQRSNEPPRLTSFEPNRDSPQGTGTAIRWTARAEDPDDETLYYRFLLKGPSTGGSWDEVQGWSTQRWWGWEPTEVGIYRVQVEVRDGDHSGPGGLDDFRISDVYEIEELAGSGEAQKSNEPPRLTSFEPNRESPQGTGTAIRWTARAEDPDDETLYYRFLLKGPSTGGSWDAVQDWSTQSWWEWTPSEAGSYQVQADVRDGDHAGPEGRDDFRISNVYVIEAAPTDGKRVAFIYSSDRASGESYKSLLDSKGLATDLIPVGGNVRRDYDLIIVGNDAGGAYTAIDDHETPIIGIGHGGARFFDELGLQIGWLRGWVGSNTGVYIKDNSYSVFKDPNEIPSGDVNLYTQTRHIGIYLPSPPSNVVLIGREVNDENHYPIVLQDGRYLLWGFTGSPSFMTSEGKGLFVNVADHLASGKAITGGGLVFYLPKTFILDPKVLSPSKTIST